MEVRYTICYWAINRTDPQNSLSTTLDIPLQVVKNVSKPHIQSLEIKRNQNQNKRKIKRKEK